MTHGTRGTRPRNQISESFTKFRYSHLLFAFLFAFVSHAESCGLENFDSPWHAIAADFQTFCEKKQMNLLTMHDGC
jgi:hypothetical protein